MKQASLGGEERFHLLVDSVRDYAIFMLDPEGYVATWNAGAERIKGYAEHEIVGQHFSRFYPPEDVAAGVPARVLQMAARDGSSHLEGWRVRKDGRRFWGEVTVTAIRRDGELVGFAKVTRDLTERHAAEEAHRQAAEERQRRVAAEEAARLRSEFLSIAAHELKTPLTSLRGMAQLALRRFERDGEVDLERLRQALRVIETQSGKVARLIEQLLDVSRVESGHLRLSRQEADLGGLLRGVLTMFTGRGDGARVLLDLPDKPVVASVDSLRLEQVLTNLIDNALKYSPAGSPVCMSVTYEPDSVRIAVEDRGPGVPEEDRPRLFDRFYRSRVTSHTSGMGLGLHVSREIVALHGGTLIAEFPAEGGTRMVVTLPAD